MSKRVFTEEHKKALSDARKGRAPWNKGKSGVQEYSKQTRKKMSLARIGRFAGENHPFWKGGITATSAKRWREKNMDRVLFLNRRRRAMKLNAEGSYTEQEWLDLKAKYGFMCLCCKKEEPEIKLTEDHVIPLSKGGTNYISNIQPLCKSCNCKKHTKIINYAIK